LSIELFSELKNVFFLKLNEELFGFLDIVVCPIHETEGSNHKEKDTFANDTVESRTRHVIRN